MTNTLNLTIGSAPDSWGVWFASDPHQTPWQHCLDEIAAAGYEWTELGPLGYLPTDIAALRTELDKRGLKTSGTFVQADLAQPGIWSKLEGQVLQAGEVLAQLDAKFLVLIDGIYTDERTGAPLQPARLDEAGWGRFLESVHKVDELARGVVDFIAFRDVLIECGYQGWAIVEQDMYPAPFDKPLPIAMRNRAYLRQIGMG